MVNAPGPQLNVILLNGLRGLGQISNDLFIEQDYEAYGTSAAYIGFAIGFGDVCHSSTL
jgi:hypothetical protein